MKVVYIKIRLSQKYPNSENSIPNERQPMCDNLKILNAIKQQKSDEGAIIQNTAFSDQACKPHTNVSLRIKQTGFKEVCNSIQG